MAIGQVIRGALAKMPWRSEQGEPRVAGAVIVQYPPVAAGIPALPVERILQSHGETLAKIRHLVEREADWEVWYMPLITRYAQHVHLLPASEYHHHRGAGGLLAHGLEVGLLTLQQAREKLYGMKLEPRLRRLARPRWQYGCFLAGLCHDVGKPLMLRVTSAPEGRGLSDWDDGIWQPYAQDILSWCRAQAVERYWVSFRQRSARDHERSSALIWDRVITEVDRRFLSEYDSELLPMVLAALQGAHADHDMGKLVLSADRRSVQEDLGKSHRAQDIGQDVSLPVMRIYGDAMLRLIRENFWLVNQPGSRLWYVESGLYLVWPEGGRDIGVLLDRDEAYRGVPRRPQVMAEIFQEWNYVESTPGGSPFWWLKVEGVEKPLLALKVREPRGLMEVLPAPCSGEAKPYEAGAAAEQAAAEPAQEKPGGGAGSVAEGQGEPAGLNQAALSPSLPDRAPESPEPGLALVVVNNQEDRQPVLSRIGRELRSVGEWTVRALWGCVPAMVRERLEAITQEEGMDCVEIKERLWWLNSRLEARDFSSLCPEEQDEYDAIVVEAYGLVRRHQALCAACGEVDCPDAIRVAAEPAWVREICWLLADGVAVSEFEAERIKRRLGGSGRIRDWFEVSPAGYVLSGLE
ncbi:MAG: MobH family relaxase [Halothiobacillaceae bacterium]